MLATQDDEAQCTTAPMLSTPQNPLPGGSPHTTFDYIDPENPFNMIMGGTLMVMNPIWKIVLV